VRLFFTSLMQSLEITTAADPARHAWNVLADFVDSLTSAEARRSVQKLVNWDRKLQVCALSLHAARQQQSSARVSCVCQRHVAHWPQEEEEMAAASLELDGMAGPAQVPWCHAVSRMHAELHHCTQMYASVICLDLTTLLAAGKHLAAGAAHAGAQSVHRAVHAARV
jgi:hypothetical protein